MKQWGIFCKPEEVKDIQDKISEYGVDIFETRPLTFDERLQYVEDPHLFASDVNIVMFRCSTIKYHWIVFRLGLNPVF